MTRAPLIRNSLRWLLALLLLWAALSKLANPTNFLASLYGYSLPLPTGLFKVIAVVLPWIELLCGLMLLGRKWVETALAATTGMFVVFIFATGQAWLRGLDISCGCFDLKLLGFDGQNSVLVHFLESVGFAFIRNLLLCAAAGFLLWQEFKPVRATEFVRAGPKPQPVPVVSHGQNRKRRRRR